MGFFLLTVLCYVFIPTPFIDSLLGILICFAIAFILFPRREEKPRKSNDENTINLNEHNYSAGTKVHNLDFFDSCADIHEHNDDSFDVDIDNDTHLLQIPNEAFDNNLLNLHIDSDTDHIERFAKDFNNNPTEVYHISDGNQLNYFHEEAERNFDYPKPDNSGNQTGMNSRITIFNQENPTLNASIKSLDAECIVSHTDLGAQGDINFGNLINTNNEPEINSKMDQVDRLEVKPIQEFQERLIDIVVDTVAVIYVDDENTQHPSSQRSKRFTISKLRKALLKYFRFKKIKNKHNSLKHHIKI